MSGVVSNTTGINRGESAPATRLPGLLGFTHHFDNKASLTALNVRDARKPKFMLVKNGHSTVLLPGTIVFWKTLLAGSTVVPTAASAGAPSVGVVDFLAPAAGIPVGDAFWMCIAGPTKFLNDNGGALSEFGKIIASAAVAGLVKTAGATPTFDAVGYAEEAAAQAAGASLAQGVSFWGVFASPHIS